MLKFKELDDKKKRLIIIVSVLVVFIGVTLAYVVGQISDGAIGNANITADTTDNLQFSVDKDISLNPTQFNVTEGGGGLSDTAVGTATLLANSTNEAATYDYYVYFRINNNNYIYTTDDAKPEIVLTILDPDNNPVTSLPGLEYVTVQNADGTTISGFDITTQKGMINIAQNYEITSNSKTDPTIQNWTFTVTFINLPTNQKANGGKIMEAQIILSKDIRGIEEAAITDVYAYTSPDSIKVRAVSNVKQDMNYYYSIDNGVNYVGPIAEETYAFTGLENNKEYNIKVYATNALEEETNKYTIKASTREPIDLNYTLLSGSEFSKKLGDDASKVKSIIFEKGYGVDSTPVATYDVTEAQNNLVKAYLLEDGTLKVQADKPIVANANCANLFVGFSNLENVDASTNFDASKITDITGMFSGLTNLKNINLSNWNTSSLESIPIAAFAGLSAETFDLSNWDVSSVTFIGASAFVFVTTDVFNLSSWDTSSITSIGGSAFYGLSADVFDLSGWDTSNFTGFGQNVFGNIKTKTFCLSDWDVSGITVISNSLFNSITADVFDLSGWDVSSITAIGANAFSNITADTVNLSNWDTSKVTAVGLQAFYNINANYVDLQSWNLLNAKIVDTSVFNSPNTTFRVSSEEMKTLLLNNGATNADVIK